jgi:hypothetical protein
MLENMGGAECWIAGSVSWVQKLLEGLHWFWLTTWMEWIVVVPDFPVKLLFVRVQFGSNMSLLDGI